MGLNLMSWNLFAPMFYPAHGIKSFPMKKGKSGKNCFGIKKFKTLKVGLLFVTVNSEPDDTNIFITAESETEVYKLANKTISRMRLYMISNQLHINLSKCTYIHFKPKQVYIHTF